MLELNQIYNEDCLGESGMCLIPDKSVDMILCDLPYGTTEAEWDSVLPLDKLWNEYRRLLKPNGAVVLTASQPFTSILTVSNLEWFKYSWVWRKENATGHLNAKARPLKQHEDILVFSNGSATSTSLTMTYNPQGLQECEFVKVNRPTETTGRRKSREHGTTWNQKQTGYPRSILDFGYDQVKWHPTQKPVELFKYLIRTYTNKGDTVLDNCIGSGTTAVACIATQRNFIGFELDMKHHKNSIERIANVQSALFV